MIKISNFKYKISNITGFTLVELLVVIVVLITVGGIITAILVSSLRSSNKSAAVNNVRQSGDLAIVQMSKMIEYAKTFQGVSTGVHDIDGNLIYETDCTVPNITPTPASVQYSSIKFTSFDGGTTEFSCTGDTIASNSAINLIDTSNITVSSCYFLCTQSNVLSSPTIDINFTLSNISPGTFVENQVSIPFETTVLLRNYNN